MHKPQISIVGAGTWGTTIAFLLARKKYSVRLWVREQELYDAMIKTGINSKYLPGYKLLKNIVPTRSEDKITEAADILIMGIPAQYARIRLRRFAKHLQTKTIVVNLGKGMELSSGKRISQIFREELASSNPIGVLSGPNISFEIMKKIPAKSVVSCDDVRYLSYLQEVFTTDYFRVYTNPDITGVELGGALKNIIAIVAGISDGLGYKDNTKASLITRGMAELLRLSVMMGANPHTLYGLSGVGDLVVTCFSPDSRNRRLGEALGKGMSLHQAEDSLQGRVAEGVATTKAVRKLCRQLKISMPITEQLYQVLYRDKPPAAAFKAIWDARPESEL
jgi:glycerol-3-phosphate dehydrogenase (NAD(P)+)